MSDEFMFYKYKYPLYQFCFIIIIKKEELFLTPL